MSLPIHSEPRASGFPALLGCSLPPPLVFLIPLFIGWLAVWGASWILPPKYKSGTLILVEQPTMPKDYVVPNVTENLQERLQSITQQILSRSRLLHIVDEIGLYSASASACRRTKLWIACESTSTSNWSEAPIIASAHSMCITQLISRRCAAGDK